MQTNNPSLDTLKRLRPLSEFESSQLIELAQQLKEALISLNTN